MLDNSTLRAGKEDSQGWVLGPIAVHEARESAQKRAQEALRSLGYRVCVESSAEAVERRCKGEEPPDVLLVGLPEGAELVKRLSEEPRAPLIIASLAGPADTAMERFGEMGTELYTVRPHSVDSLGPLMVAASSLVRRERQLLAKAASVERLRRQLEEAGHSGSVAGMQHMQFFQRLLKTEIKRAKRFGYGIAVCLIAREIMGDDEPTQAEEEELIEIVARAITGSIRDIDMSVDYADNRMLLFLPYTDSSGAKELAERVARAVAKAANLESGGRILRMRLSIGVSALREGKEVSFAKLLRDAKAALKAAQLKGGRRVVVR